MKLVIFGAHSGNNKGDLAILISMIENINLKSKDVDFLIGSKNPSEIKKHMKYKNVTLTKDYFSYFGKKTIKNIRESDLIIYGGGGLFFSRNLLNPGISHILNMFGLTLLNKIFFHKKIYLFGVGVSHLNSTLAKKMTSFILNNSDIITVRDSSSKKELNTLTNKEISIYPDPAFLLKEKDNSKFKEYFEKNKLKKKKVIFCINDSLFKVKGGDKNVSELSEVLDKLSKTYEVFIFQNDEKQNIINKIGSKNIKRIPFRNLSPSEIISLITYFDYSITSPMHFGIFSYLSKTPSILINYDDKINNFAKITKNKRVVDLDKLRKIPRMLNMIDEKIIIDRKIINSARENFIGLMEFKNEIKNKQDN
jgi:polysaccharide pyruvyl transferase WcaK-like protein